MSDERVRLFVALELPDPVRDGLTHWRDRVRAGGSAKLRPVAAHALHVTLCFLGWRGKDEVEALAAACGTVAPRAAPRLILADGLWLPRRRPRVLAVRLKDPERALARIQGELSDALSAGGWYEREKRPYLAHVTVARLRATAGSRLPELPDPPHTEFTASRVVLYRSRLSPSGAQYEALSSVTLVLSTA